VPTGFRIRIDSFGGMAQLSAIDTLTMFEDPTKPPTPSEYAVIAWVIRRWSVDGFFR
jgi:hypothetical protein